MKALTLSQPWSSLVAVGAKRIETRSWSTKYRGPLAIHAARGWTPADRGHFYEAPFQDALRRGGVPTDSGPDALPRGAVLAIVELYDVVPIVERYNPRLGRHVAPDEDGLIRIWTPAELAGQAGHVGGICFEDEGWFGNYTPGRAAWLLRHIRPLSEPIPARGSLGLWNWNHALRHLPPILQEVS